MNVVWSAACVGKAHGMLSIVGLEDGVIQTLCQQALAGSSAGTVCQLANFLFPQVHLIGSKCNVDLTAAIGIVAW